MSEPNRYTRWKKKLRYLVVNHGGLAAIARAAGLKPQSLDLMLQAAPPAGSQRQAELAPAAAKQIENELDLPDGWFDASVFLPSKL